MDFARHGWLLLVGVTLLNVLFSWYRITPVIRRRPELAEGYRRLFRGLSFWTSLPWLVMGVGCELGGVPQFIDFLFPATGGPFVWGFWVVVYGLFFLLLYWGVWGNGAGALVRYPGVINLRTESVERMRWYLGGSAVFGMVWNAGVLLWLAQQ